MGRQVHAALHGRAGPGRIAVLVRQRPALAGGQAVQHGADKGAPGGLAGFVGSVQHIQPRRERQFAVVQAAEGAGQVQNIHGVILL